ncbi:hypothetical protein CDAR_94181 [Caerostris darwini]|uniref:Uncharacterized protein n=1 Tax=Caerostris darwini TaxID=1538125 RepID=A0AAV4NMY4_9ARAC|nr:hypothetical protein CDAR_94181 [Caerostris darwini]
MCHSPLMDLDVSEVEFAVKECPSFEKTQLQKDNCNQENLSSQNGRPKNYSTRKSEESGEVCHGDLKSGIVSELVFWDGLRPRECVEQLAPEVLLPPSEVGGVFEIELDLLGQLIVLGQVSQLDDDDALNVVFQGLDVGQLELQKAPLAFQKIPEKKEHRSSASEEQDSFNRNPVTGERMKENYFRLLLVFFVFYTYCNGLLLSNFLKDF